MYTYKIIKKRTRVPVRSYAAVLPKQRETAILIRSACAFGILTNRIERKKKMVVATWVGTYTTATIKYKRTHVQSLILSSCTPTT